MPTRGRCSRWERASSVFTCESACEQAGELRLVAQVRFELI